MQEEAKSAKAALTLAEKLDLQSQELLFRMGEELMERSLKQNTALPLFQAEVLQWLGSIDVFKRVVYLTCPETLFNNCQDHFFARAERKYSTEEMIEEWLKIDERVKRLSSDPEIYGAVDLTK